MCPTRRKIRAPNLRVLTARAIHIIPVPSSLSLRFPSLFLLCYFKEHPEEISSPVPPSILENVAGPPFSTEDADVISEREPGQT